ncbi:MAG TPA: quinone-dependent dihydroorotate dehydrogenase [Burkholderiales bacterium]|nr:quinone-dependent dihydroorotate dehydrogenase [Burkholderiales bacterium]
MLYALARPLLFALDPETAHRLTLRLSGLAALLAPRPPACPVRAMGLDFPNPVGLAAGLDKDAEHADALAALGFGFLELGGVTPRPQPGNPRPRVFRIPEAQALINRYGLNSVGIDAFVENLKRRTTKAVVGVNVGKNRDTPNEKAADDYAICFEKLYPHVDYVTLNVSSPNTVGLRDLQGAEILSALLSRMKSLRERLRERHGRNVAVAIKIAPDLEPAAIRGIAEAAKRERIDGIVATNTTVHREGVAGYPHAGEQGGLSGGPLRVRSTDVIGALCRELKGEIPVIGVGGILRGADAVEKLDAGASLVQIYTGLIYRGPELISECVSACLAKSRTASFAPP